MGCGAWGAGCGAGCVQVQSAADSQATFPVDVFKTRMQAASWHDETDARRPGSGSGSGRGEVGESGAQGQRRPPSLWSVARGAVRREGWRVMFAGLGPTLIRAVPVSGVAVRRESRAEGAAGADV